MSGEIAEPEADSSDVDGAAVDEVPLEVQGSDGAELAEGALDGAALLVRPASMAGGRPPLLS